ncbi:NDP-sugar synthase [Alteromonas lipolytica]|uniref:Mannose-1-phosphate guanyltransferase C-terminal domain-containing protein n=1 Tax=Alteromonas lipolytica TaxID=1856405 RepID=A0A1E8FAU8_9ALTE|nr:NDP-sugar synthase [Alteromonas lipolytica]OFI33057.1 hypothetical protein BFC17_01950 [Alteromonas lipolytica]GGF62911.1 hypothetical protein GCM10011338_14170 [Alteromonas lipolytica]
MQTPLNSYSLAVLIEPTDLPALQPLLVRRSLALLPVAGKPIIQLWLEHISLMGFTSVSIGVRDFPQALRDFVGNGSRWGLSIEVHALTEHMSNEDAVAHIAAAGPQLVACLNAIPTDNLSILLSHQVSEATVPFTAGTGQYPLAYLLPKASEAGQEKLCIPLTAEFFKRIDSVSSLWQVNNAILHGQTFDPLPSGFEVEPGIFMETGIQVKPGVNMQGPVKIGQNSYLGRNVKIKNNVVIGACVIIEDGCELENTLILDNTYVGAQSNLSNVVIDGASVFSLQAGTFTWINDPSILGWTNSAANSVSVLERITALALMAVFLPAMLTHAALQCLRRRPVFKHATGFIPQGMSFTGQPRHQTLALMQFTSGNHRFNKLPWLTEVVKGNLHLVGIGLPSSTSQPIPQWAFELQNKRPGVITLHESQPAALAEETHYVEDLYYLNHCKRPRNLLILLNWVTRLCIAGFSFTNRKNEARL